ncbi:hypothetical protein JHK87_004171 [Glycine soja]|nr:hypothetical protein JHK87_004171 [Glycine soja]
MFLYCLLGFHQSSPQKAIRVNDLVRCCYRGGVIVSKGDVVALDDTDKGVGNEFIGVEAIVSEFDSSDTESNEGGSESGYENDNEGVVFEDSEEERATREMDNYESFCYLSIFHGLVQTLQATVNEGHAKGDTVVKSTVAINDNIVIVIQSQQAKNELVIKVQQPEVSQQTGDRRVEDNAEVISPLTRVTRSKGKTTSKGNSLSVGQQGNT